MGACEKEGASCNLWEEKGESVNMALFSFFHQGLSSVVHVLAGTVLVSAED